MVLRSRSPLYSGRLSSLDSQPLAFSSGSVATRSITTWSHLGHSNQRASKPALSGEMRASLNGRSLLQRRDRAQWEGLLAWRVSLMVAVTSLYILVAIAVAC